MEKIKVAVIGLGGIAEQVHLLSLKDLEAEGLVQIQGICDSNKDRLDCIGNKFNIKNRFTDYKKLIKESPIDGILILSSPKATLEIATFALTNKKHIMIEKPPGMNITETRAIFTAAQGSGCTAMVAYNRRYSPVMIEARKRVLEKGRITSFQSEFHKKEVGNVPYYQGDNWLVVDIIHHIDTLFWLGGKKVNKLQKSIHSFAGSSYPNCFQVLIDFEDTCGILHANYVSGTRIEKFEIHGEGISAYVEPPHKAEIFINKNAVPEIITAKSLTGQETFHRNYGFYSECKHFVESIRENKMPDTPIEDSVKIMELIQCILDPN